MASEALDPVLTAAAAREVKFLVGLAQSPDKAEMRAIAGNLSFQYRIGSCDDTEFHRHYCQHEIESQTSKAARLLAVVLGRGTKTGMPSGRVVWAVWDKRVCLNAADLSKLLGEGEVVESSIAYIPPNSTTIPPTYQDVAYTTIPGGVAGSSAIATYVGRCVSQIAIEF